MHFYAQVPMFFTSLCVPGSKIKIVYYQTILIKPPSRTRSAGKTATPCQMCVTQQAVGFRMTNECCKHCGEAHGYIPNENFFSDSAETCFPGYLLVHQATVNKN